MVESQPGQEVYPRNTKVKEPIPSGRHVVKIPRRDSDLAGAYYVIHVHRVPNYYGAYAFIEKSNIKHMTEAESYASLLQVCRDGMISHVVGFVEEDSVAKARFSCPGTVTNIYLDKTGTQHKSLEYQNVTHPVLGKVRLVTNQSMTLARVVMSLPCYLESVLR
jgi:hypothetical protein